MAETKWTPGEWNYSHHKASDGMYRTQVYCAKGETIATFDWYAMPENEHGVIRTSRDANARLCAAAPDLYAALEFALSDESGFACPTATEERLRAALAKARGEA